jgi:polar amino acid transport system permease protein
MPGFTLQIGEVLRYWPVLVGGLEATFALSAISLGCGLVLGLLLGLGRLSRAWPLRVSIAAFIEVFRNTPALVQLIWFFYVLPAVTGMSQNVFLSCAIALSLNSAAFTAEIFRGGIQSISKGQWDAARAIGMGPLTLMRHIILPQAVKRMVPALANRAIEIVKLTALTGTLGYTDLLYQGQLISAASYRPIEAYTMVAMVFVVVLSLLATGSRLLEHRLRRNE